MDFDPVLLARLQFAFTIAFHIIFPSFTIGLSAYIATLHVTAWLTEHHPDLAVDQACQGQGIGKRLIEETRKEAGGPLTTTLLLSAPTAMSFYQGIKMPHADNCFLYRRER